MTLKEIRAQLRVAEAAPIAPDGTSDYFDLLPRVPFCELPKSLQIIVRTMDTPQFMAKFLTQCCATPEVEESIHYIPDDAKETLEMSPCEQYTFKTLTAGIPKEKLDTILIRTRNIAIYTIQHAITDYDIADNLDPTQPPRVEASVLPKEPELIPNLYGNHATEAFEKALAEYNNTPAQKKDRNQQSTSISVGKYQSAISDKQYRNALTPRPNNTAFIVQVTPDILNSFTLENGELTVNREIADYISSIKVQYDSLREFDRPLLIQIYTAAIKSHVAHDNSQVTVSIPKFFHEMNVSTNDKDASNIMRKLKNFEGYVGVLPTQQKIMRLFVLISFDLKKQEMTFAAPFLTKIMDDMKEKNTKTKKLRNGETIQYITPHHNELMYSTIVSERNKAATELVEIITTGLLQRGATPDCELPHNKKKIFPDGTREVVTFHKTFREILKQSSLLNSRIKEYKKTSTSHPEADQNKALRRAFEKAYELIRTQTDAYEYFNDLQIDSSVIPTMTTLDNELTITHKGINGAYHKKT